jgi:hypothetical protein
MERASSGNGVHHPAPVVPQLVVLYGPCLGGRPLFSYIKVRERQLRLRNQVLEKKVEERTAEVVAQSKEIEGQKGRIEDLLLNILPKEISEELKDKGKATARRHEEVTVMFTDMKGFTQGGGEDDPGGIGERIGRVFHPIR